MKEKFLNDRMCFMNDNLLLKALASHVDVIKQWVADERERTEDSTSNVNATDDPVERLPRKLRRKLRNRRAFRKACRERLIVYRDNEWNVEFETKNVFAYFCGRCFSEDFVEDGIVEKGEFPFPASEIDKAFGVVNMRDSRKNQLNRKISKRCKGIDYLFDTSIR